MLVFPAWRSDLPRDGCRVPRWMPAERFAPYFARPVALPPHPPQVRYLQIFNNINVWKQNNNFLLKNKTIVLYLIIFHSLKMKIRRVVRPLIGIPTQLITRRVCACGEDAAHTSPAWRVSPHTSRAHMRLRTEMDSSIADGRDVRDHKEALMHGTFLI